MSECGWIPNCWIAKTLNIHITDGTEWLYLRWNINHFRCLHFAEPTFWHCVYHVNHSCAAHVITEKESVVFYPYFPLIFFRCRSLFHSFILIFIYLFLFYSYPIAASNISTSISHQSYSFFVFPKKKVQKKKQRNQPSSLPFDMNQAPAFVHCSDICYYASKIWHNCNFYLSVVWLMNNCTISILRFVHKTQYTVTKIFKQAFFVKCSLLWAMWNFHVESCMISTCKNRVDIQALLLLLLSSLELFSFIWFFRNSILQKIREKKMKWSKGESEEKRRKWKSDHIEI